MSDYVGSCRIMSDHVGSCRIMSDYDVGISQMSGTFVCGGGGGGTLYILMQCSLNRYS